MIEPHRHAEEFEGGRMETIEVGKRYPGRWETMQEGARYDYSAAGHLLQLFLPGATGREVRAVRAGRAEFALAVEGPVIFLLMRFDVMPWSEAPFSIHLVSEERRRTTLRSPDSGERRNMLQIHLVDTRSGLTKALRVCGLHSDFIDAFETALREQLACEWRGREAYDAELAGIYRRHPRGDDLVRKSIARCAFPAR
ncbi:MAG: hypothetical protein M3P49_17550 [Actinomycetota bacterium]|nr:hypothetical protein [Actinomycetota bacterium]